MTLRAVMLVLGALAALVISPWLGLPLDGPQWEFVLYELRLPRVLLGALVGATLGVTGAAFQAVLENPLATPSTIGTTAGASLGALAVLVVWPALAASAGAVALGAFAGAALVSGAMAVLASSARLRVEDLLLAGIAVSLGAGAATMGLQLQADAAQTLAAVRWSLGSLSTIGYGEVRALMPWVVVGLAGTLSQRRALQAMIAGHARAASQGVSVTRVRVVVLGAGSVAVGGCVAAAGPIGFVGLIVPHLVRLFTGGGPRVVVPLSGVVGAGFLPLADGLARVAWAPRELPVGVLTAMLGAPTLVWLIWRRRHDGGA